MKITAQIEQNIFDIALQYYGNADAVYDILYANKITYNTPLMPNLKLEVTPQKNKTTEYFNNKTIATGEIYLYTLGNATIDTDYSTFIID
ncbi:MAG: hypothetical protein HPY79_11880 [Bacteroidales bacterium]|nr:hypothetical protein [Bacteroidales bacterium]